MRALGLIAVSLLLACQPPPAARRAPEPRRQAFVPPEEPKGPQVWIGLESEHFSLATDLPAESARHELRLLELRYSTIVDVAFPQVIQRRPIQLVIFRAASEYNSVGPKVSGGFFRSSMAGGDVLGAEPVLVMGSVLSDITAITFQHELTHYFVQASYGSVPLWLTEGLAQFYETTRTLGDKAVFGEFLAALGTTNEDTFKEVNNPPVRRLLVPVSRVPTIEQLLAADRDTFYAARRKEAPSKQQQDAYYVGAWALVHLMLNGPPRYRERFGRLLQSLERHKGRARAAFDGVDRAELERDYRAHLSMDRLLARATRYVPPPAVVGAEIKPLDFAALHVLRARLFDWSGEGLDHAEEELTAALERSPSDPEAHLFRGLLRLSRSPEDLALPDLESVLAARPNDERALAALATYYLHEAQRKGSRAESERYAETFDKLAKVAQRSTSLRLLAWREARRQAPDAGLPLVLRALALDPGSPQCLDTLAVLLMGKKRYAEALDAEDRALDALPEGQVDRVLEERRAEIAKKVSGAAAKP